MEIQLSLNREDWELISHVLIIHSRCCSRTIDNEKKAMELWIRIKAYLEAFKGQEDTK